jgi:hypothetical protein
MRQGAADGTAIADGDVTDLPQRLDEHRPAAGDFRATLGRALARSGADRQRAIRLDPNVLQRGDPVDIDQNRWPGQAHVHQRHQALASSQHLRIFPVLGQESDCCVDRLGGVVGEGC